MKCPLPDHPVHILKSRTEIRAALTDDGKVTHVGFHLLTVCDQTVLLHLLITLDDVDVSLLKIAVRLAEHIVGLLQEPPYQIPRAGHGRVNHHHKILNPAHFFGFQRLH